MKTPLTFTRQDWLDQAKLLLPGLTQEQRDELYEDMLATQAEHERREAEGRS